MNKTKKTLTKITTLILTALIITNLASAITIKSVTAPTLAPGEEGEIIIELENNFDDDATDISLQLALNGLPFISIGSSEASISELETNDEEELTFKIKASNDINPGDYEIPYNLQYTINKEIKKRTGSIGIKVNASPELAFTVSTEKPILNMQDKLSLKIINKGLADARFVSVKILPQGFTLLSEKEVYIGSIESDDFETADFDIIYTSKSPVFSAILEYTDFNNKRLTKIINLPVNVYTREKALELGLTNKNNTPFYIGIVITIILIFILYRIVRKNIRRKKLNNLKEA